MPEFSVSVSSHVALLIAGLLAAIGMAAWAYQHTTPAVSRPTRVLLGSLRGATLALLILVLGELVLLVMTRTEEPPAIVVLTDNSRSMGIQDSFEDRRKLLEGVLSSPELHELRSAAPIQDILFDSKARSVAVLVPDSISLGGDVTNIAEALRFVGHEREKHNIRAVLLISDGMVTEGGNPVYEVGELNMPIYAIGVGDTSSRRDVRVHTVLSNAVAYVDTKVPVTADIRSSGFSSQRVEVLLRGDEGVLDRHVLDLTAATGRMEVGLWLTPRKAGIQRYTVEVSLPGADAVPANNRSSFYVKVIEKKISVLLLAGAPSPDVAFIRRSLESDASLTVQPYVQHIDGGFLGGPLADSVLQKCDCVIMVGYPSARSDRGTLDRVLQTVREGKSYLQVLSQATDISLLKKFEPGLPVTVSSGSEVEVEMFLSVATGEHVNPLVRGAGESESATYWTGLPPVIRRDIRTLPRPESKVLLVGRLQGAASTEAVYVSRAIGGHRSLFLGVYGLWQWNMHTATPEADPVASFVSPAVRWLSAREEEKPLTVRPLKEVFSGQESVELLAQVYDETLQPVDNAEVRLTLEGTAPEQEAVAEPRGSGRYVALFEGLGTGTYTYSAKATADGIVLGKDRGSFSVGELTVEFQDVRLHATLLRQLAERSGGKFYQAGELGGLAQMILAHPQFQSSTRRETRTLELWNAPWVLGLLVLLLAAEWALRKRSGMI